MNVSELAQNIAARGHEVRTRREEVLIKTCLYCANARWNLEVSASKGVYHCWACGASGIAASLLERIGADVPDGLEVRYDGESEEHTSASFTLWPGGTVWAKDQPSALAFLRSRGIDQAEAHWLRIGVTLEGPYAPRLVFPLRDYWSGDPVGYVTRKYGPAGDGPKYLSAVNVTMSLPGWPPSDTGERIHVIVEGVFDALSVRRAGYGAAVLLGTGRLDDARAWVCRVGPGEPVVIMLDADAKDVAQRLYWTLRSVSGAVHVAKVPPGRDPGEMGVDEIRDVVRRCLMD